MPSALFRSLSRTQRFTEQRLSLIFKQRTKQDYAIQKQEHKMCKTNMKMNFYYVNVFKHEHEKNMTRLWCKIVL
jgi:hypothetical protein